MAGGKMTQYWLCVTDQPNWTVIKERSIWGVSERNKHKLESVKEGDMLVFYVKPKMVAGIFKAKTTSFINQSEVFISKKVHEGEKFPHRIKLEKVLVLEKPIDIEELVSSLTFIISKKMWRGYFRRAMQKISKQDY